MNHRVIAEDLGHLKKLIEDEIRLNGNECDLNFIDVSKVTSMSDLFARTQFNGNISKWDVSNVKNMCAVFLRSKFNGDISEWDVSNVENMDYMFFESEFNGDISRWNVSSLNYMEYMFLRSQFKGDISEWKVLNLGSAESIFICCSAPIPYWASINDKQTRKNAIESYHLHKKLEENLVNDGSPIKKVKI